jgi:hypothetical protein
VPTKPAEPFAASSSISSPPTAPSSTKRTRAWTLSPADDLNPSVYNTLIALHWLDSLALPRRFDDVLRLDSVAALDTAQVRTIFAEVEAATLGAWDTLTSEVGVSSYAHKTWNHELQPDLRADFRAQATPPANRPRLAPRQGRSFR